MTNAELIKALRHCGKGGDIAERCLPCDYYDREPWCEAALVNDAADALEAADKKTVELNTKCADLQSQINEMENEIEELMPKRGEWLRTDAFPHRVYCSCCYKTYVPNENWQIWQDDADNFGLPRNYCPNCGARMKGEQE